MRKIFNYFAIVLVLLGANISYAQTGASKSNLKSELSRDKLSRSELDRLYDKISSLIEAKEANLSMKDLLELCVMYYKHDRTDAAFDFTVQLKKANPKEFESALKQLSKEDAEKIKEFLNIGETIEAKGNG